jgi:hypothetical protein
MAEQTQKSYQEQITASLGTTDDNAVLSLSKEEMIKDTPVIETPAELIVDNNESVVNDLPDAPIDPSYTKDQVQAIVRTRVANLEKRLEKMKQSESAVDRIAEISGLSKDQLITRLNSMSDAEQAKILGIPPELVANVRAAQSVQKANEEQIKKLNRDLEMTSLKSDKKYSDIDLFMDEVLSKIEDHPSLTLKDAYTLVKGELGLTATVRDAEQRVLNSQAASKGKGLVNPVGAANAAPLKMSEAVLSGAKQVGMDPNEYAAYEQIGSLDAYRAYKQSQRGGK